MDLAIKSFLAAHELYTALDEARFECTSPQQRECMHIEIMRAYLELQKKARIVAGLHEEDGMPFATPN